MFDARRYYYYDDDRRRRVAALGGGPPAWVLRADGVVADLDIDFVNDLAWNNSALVSIASLLTCSRASTGYYTKADGTLVSFLSNVLRYGTNGLLVEEARTNVPLHSGDLTNAAWTKTDCTAAQDQTGPDGVTNSMSSLTATGANATCLQAITLASSARFQTCYIKRITGSGVIEMTMDNGATWTAVTVTGSITRVSIPTQTLANPTVGWRIVTSGDAIAVGWINNENGTSATSYIPTTTTSVTRALDNVFMLTSGISAFNSAAGSTYSQYGRLTPHAGNTANKYCGLSNNDGAKYSVIRHESTNARMDIAGGAANANLVQFAVWTAGVEGRMAGAVATNDAAMSFNGLAVNTDAVVEAPAVSRIQVGGLVATQVGNWHVARYALWNSRLSNAALAALTT